MLQDGQAEDELQHQRADVGRPDQSHLEEPVDVGPEGLLRDVAVGQALAPARVMGSVVGGGLLGVGSSYSSLLLLLLLLLLLQRYAFAACLRVLYFDSGSARVPYRQRPLDGAQHRLFY